MKKLWQTAADLQGAVNARLNAATDAAERPPGPSGHATGSNEGKVTQQAGGSSNYVR